MNIRCLQRTDNSRPKASDQRMGALATLPVDQGGEAVAAELRKWVS